ncbi:MAG: UvrD-helicase domain-containing protein [Chloroflexota bacterium]|nr:UvrD-helicase domain-containing protein [Chloroflexota bacterium]
MDEHTRALVVAVARQLLLNYRAAHPEWTDDRTPVDHLVAWLGLAVETFHPDDYADGTYGWLEPGEDLIWLCRDLRETLRRFTLAHELGHALLHRQHNAQIQALLPELAFLASAAAIPRDVPAVSPDDPCQQPDVQEALPDLTDEDVMQEVLGVGQSYSPRSQRELAANIFAAELLMPLERVYTLYLAHQVPPARLASLFDVSSAAMLNRLVGLLKLNEQSKLAQDVALLANAQSTRREQPQPVAKRRHYDEFQQAAIEAPTPALIVAGPGSGKTSTLIGRAQHLIHTLGVPPQHILALTFSRKAAEEMQERLQLALDTGVEPASTWLLPTVSTFHAFCAELLRKYSDLAGLRPDFTFVDDAEGYFLLRRMAGALPLYHYRHLTTPTFYFPDILRAISRAKDELVTPEQYRELAQRMLDMAESDEEREKAEKSLEVAAVYALYQEELRRRGDTDFGGLLMLVVQLLEEHSQVCEEQHRQYQHILVDEFQDINRASGVLLRLLAGDARRVWVVGDANQAIYGFRGASPANIANFRDDYPGAVVLPLSRNYRSRPDIVELAEAFRFHTLEPPAALGESQPMRNQAARDAPSDPYVTLAAAEDEASELAGLIADIRYKRGQGYRYQDMVVLCRTRAQARKISRALAAANLPIIEGGGMLEQEHIKDLLAIVLLLAEPSGMGLLRVARLPEHALSQQDIEALLLAAREQHSPPGLLVLRGEAPLSMSITGRHALTRLAEILQSLSHNAFDVWSLLAYYLFVETSLVRELLTVEDRTRARHMLADYSGLLQLARRYDQQQQLLRAHSERQAAREPEAEAYTPPAAPTIQEQAKGFVDYLTVLLTLRQDGGNRQQGAESEDGERADVIRVMTVHASKGLEFPVIYLPGLSQQRFPTMRRYNPIPPPAGMLPAESEDAAVHESGEACLFYVGVTRARDHLVLSYSERQRKRKSRSSQFLDPLRAALPAGRLTTLCWQESAEVAALSESADELLPSSQPGEQFIQAMEPEILPVSAVETYQNCPRKYVYGHIYRFQLEDGAYYLFLQATRKSIEALHTQAAGQGDEELLAVRLPSKSEARDLYTQHWQALGGHETPFALLYEQHGHEVVEMVRSKLVAAGQELTWDLRPSFTIEVAGRVIRVEVDRVDGAAQASQPVKFVRTRFGKRKQEPDPDTRELLYARVYRQQHPGPAIELHYDNLTTGEMTPIKLTEKREQSLYDKLEQSLGNLGRHEYPAAPSDPGRCPSCPFFLICPA